MAIFVSTKILFSSANPQRDEKLEKESTTEREGGDRFPTFAFQCHPQQHDNTAITSESRKMVDTVDTSYTGIAITQEENKVEVDRIWKEVSEASAMEKAIAQVIAFT
jgi:hypothetical protein